MSIAAVVESVAGPMWGRAAASSSAARGAALTRNLRQHLSIGDPTVEVEE
jgi:hypothetical protein